MPRPPTGRSRPDVPPPTAAQLALLRRLGYAELEHDSHVPFLSHLIGTRRLLARWGERPALQAAGLFHSAYGTEYFVPDRPAGRDEVRDLIGAEAEVIAHAWCTIRRDTMAAEAPLTVELLDGAAPRVLGSALAADVATLWAADTVEQIGRMEPAEQGFARGLGRVLHLASPAARTAAAPLLPT